MPITVEMKGKLEPIWLQIGYNEAINQLNMAAIGGKEFALFDTDDGQNIAVSIKNILTIREQEVDVHAGLVV